MKVFFLILVASLVVCGDLATAQPVRTQAPKIWATQKDCWASVWPALQPFIDDLGGAKLLKNSDDQIEWELSDTVSGQVVLRAGCTRSKSAGFRRYFEFGSLK